MRILLINPPASSVFARIGFGLPPLGLLYVAAVLERDGHTVELRDCAAVASLAREEMTGYGLVGITTDTDDVCFTWNVHPRSGADGGRDDRP